MTDETPKDGSKDRPVQRRGAGRKGWTKARRTLFLKALAETCNVVLSTDRAGMSAWGVYLLRRRDPAFAQLWDEALAMGYDRLETLLLQRALEGVDGIDVAAPAGNDDRAGAGQVGAGQMGGDDAGEPASGIVRAGLPGAGVARAAGSGGARGLARGDVQLALALLNRRGAKDEPRARGRKPMSAGEVDALLISKLDALARRSRPA